MAATPTVSRRPMICNRAYLTYGKIRPIQTKHKHPLILRRIHSRIPVSDIVEAHQRREAGDEGVNEIQQLLRARESRLPVGLDRVLVDGVHARGEQEENLEVEEEGDPVVVALVGRPLHDGVVIGGDVEGPQPVQEVQRAGGRLVEVRRVQRHRIDDCDGVSERAMNEADGTYVGLRRDGRRTISSIRDLSNSMWVP